MALTAPSDPVSDPVSGPGAAAPIPLPARRKGRLIRLIPPAGDRPGIRAWALSVASAAQERIAELEARVEQLQDLAMTDELTGTMNRRGFLAQLLRANEAARRGGPSGALILCDLDGFKILNDRFGHGFGDQVLRQVGSVLMRGVRRMDVVARLGGDEFAILLLGADLDAALRRAESLADAIAAATDTLGIIGFRLRASFGVAPFDGSEPDALVLHRADMAMYVEKRRRQPLAV